MSQAVCRCWKAPFSGWELLSLCSNRVQEGLRQCLLFLRNVFILLTGEMLDSCHDEWVILVCYLGQSLSCMSLHLYFQRCGAVLFTPNPWVKLWRDLFPICFSGGSSPSSFPSLGCRWAWFMPPEHSWSGVSCSNQLCEQLLPSWPELYQVSVPSARVTSI